MIVEFEGDINKEGMVIDFYDVEKMIKPLIEKLDHAFMVNKDDKIVIEFLEKMKSKKIVVDFQSTAENICSYLLGEIRKSSLPSNIEQINLRVYETNEDFVEESVRIKAGNFRTSGTEFTNYH